MNRLSIDWAILSMHALWDAPLIAAGPTVLDLRVEGQESTLYNWPRTSSCFLHWLVSESECVCMFFLEFWLIGNVSVFFSTYIVYIRWAWVSCPFCWQFVAFETNRDFCTQGYFTQKIHEDVRSHDMTGCPMCWLSTTGDGPDLRLWMLISSHLDQPHWSPCWHCLCSWVFFFGSVQDPEKHRLSWTCWILRISWSKNRYGMPPKNCVKDPKDSTVEM